MNMRWVTVLFLFLWLAMGACAAQVDDDLPQGFELPTTDEGSSNRDEGRHDGRDDGRDDGRENAAESGDPRPERPAPPKIGPGTVDAGAIASCALPTGWPMQGQRITKLELLDRTKGCVNADTGKVHNVLGTLLQIYPFVHEHTEKAIKAGELELLMLAEDSAPADSRQLVVTHGVRSDPTCKPAEQVCKYSIAAAEYDPQTPGQVCQHRPELTLANLTVEPTATGPSALSPSLCGVLAAGSLGDVIAVPVYVLGVPLWLPVRDARLSAAVQSHPPWQELNSGLLCGSVGLSDIDAAIDTLPAEALAANGFTREVVKLLVAGLMKPDIDSDGDAKPDAMSAAFGFATRPVVINGLH